MKNPIMRYFEYSHLPLSIQFASSKICKAAEYLDGTIPDGPEKSAGMRKLLEAKDCFVRASLG